MSNLPGISDGSGSESDLIVRGKRVVTPHGESAVAIHVRRGVIRMVSDFDDVRPGSLIYEAGDFVVMPGLVDTHVHINEPGRTEWEGFATATRSAAAGGITTLIEIPLNSIPPTTAVPPFQTTVDAAGSHPSVVTSFCGA